MSKKIISLILSAMLTASMFGVAAVSASAQVDTSGQYTPGEGTETKRYYFMMPEDWKNEYAETCGIYWWEGTDPADPWPGYTANETDVKNIYYCDVPSDVTTIIWNNAFNGGEDQSAPEYSKAIQSVNIGSEYYDSGESDLYPDGLDEDNGFNEMIYVIDKTKVVVSEFNGKMNCGGEWYFYYGDGTYSWHPTKEEAEAAGELFSSEYLTPGEEPEQPTTEATEPSTEATTEATEPSTEATTEATEATTEATEPVVADLTVNATSNFFPEANAVYNADTNEVTVTYTIKGTKNLLNTQWNLYFDSSVLAVSDKNKASTVMPACPSGKIVNLKLDGKVKANASAIELYDITSEETVFCEVIFDVLDLTGKTPVNTTIDLDVEELTYSVIPEGEETSDAAFDVAVVTGSVVQDNADATGTVLNTKLTESTFVPSTEPSTEATEPSTEATEPSTEATEPSTDATSSTEDTTGVDVDGDSDSDTPTKPSADTDADDKDDNGNNSNGSVQTGEASLALVVLSLLIAATGVMFVLRKREIF